MIQNLLSIFAADDSCKNYFLGLPPWYKYLEVHQQVNTPDGKVDVACVPQLHGINDLWLIGLAAIEILTRLAVLIAIAYVIYAGLKYSESRGNTDKAATAKNTLIDAITGLIIALTATAIVAFIGGRFGQP